MITNERVLCLKRADLEPIFGGYLPQGTFTYGEPESLLNLSQYFLPRQMAEHDSKYKQIIPYQLFRCMDRFFVYQRGSGVGEGRLAGRLSLGIGGHINIEDSSGGILSPEAYRTALFREREEELICTDRIETTFLGWINDDSDPVGLVHLGAVHLCEVKDTTTINIRQNSEDIHQLDWWSTEEIAAESEQFEKWSLLALELTTTHGEK